MSAPKPSNLRWVKINPSRALRRRHRANYNCIHDWLDQGAIDEDDFDFLMNIRHNKRGMSHLQFLKEEAIHGKALGIATPAPMAPEMDMTAFLARMET
jgi:hypothetical protein